MLYERHHQSLYRYCRSILRDADEAADALQSTMEKALAAIGRRDPSAPLRAWLFRIAYNESITLLRRRQPATTEDPDASALVGADVEATAERRERLAQLVRDLLELPERQRAALLMREAGGLSHEDIAAAFAVSAGAAKQAIHEARTALHDQARGRELSCDAVCRALSDGDGRTARQRRIRAHMRTCEGCRAFQAALRAGRADVAALTPLLPSATAAALLSTVAGGGSGAGGPAAALLWGGSSAAVAKTVAVGAVTVTAGAGALSLTHAPGTGDRSPRATAQTPAPAVPGEPAEAVQETVAQRTTAGKDARPASRAVASRKLPPIAARSAPDGPDADLGEQHGSAPGGSDRGSSARPDRDDPDDGRPDGDTREPADREEEEPDHDEPGTDDDEAGPEPDGDRESSDLASGETEDDETEGEKLTAEDAHQTAEAEGASVSPELD